MVTRYTIVCKSCGQQGLCWKQEGMSWKMYDHHGVRHVCGFTKISNHEKLIKNFFEAKGELE